uniref:Uncharacterized protein n=1 Tax=Anguilla anguilla TaxID=7936 RepID=A0A0E9X9G6_ANGAN
MLPQDCLLTYRKYVSVDVYTLLNCSITFSKKHSVSNQRN